VFEWRFFNDQFQYPIVMFCEEDLFNNVNLLQHIRSLTNSTVFFQQVKFELPSFLTPPVPLTIVGLSLSSRVICTTLHCFIVGNLIATIKDEADAVLWEKTAVLGGRLDASFSCVYLCSWLRACTTRFCWTLQNPLTDDSLADWQSWQQYTTIGTLSHNLICTNSEIYNIILEPIF